MYVGVPKDEGAGDKERQGRLFKKILLRLYSVDVKESLFKQGFYTLKVSEASRYYLCRETCSQLSWRLKFLLITVISNFTAQVIDIEDKLRQNV